MKQPGFFRLNSIIEVTRRIEVEVIFIMVVSKSQDCNEDVLLPYSFLHNIPRFRFREDVNEKEQGPVCFVCGDEVHPGDPMVIISRLWGKTGEDHVIDVMTSLQSCVPCSHMCTQYTVEWKYKPKLLGIEARVFHFYGKCIAGVYDQAVGDTLAKWELPKPQPWLDIPYHFQFQSADDLVGGKYREKAVQIMRGEQCQLCQQDIDINEPHITIGIAIEVMVGNRIVMHNPFAFAKYCNRCSRGFFPVDDSGFLSCIVDDF